MQRKPERPLNVQEKLERQRQETPEEFGLRLFREMTSRQQPKAKPVPEQPPTQK